MRPTTLCMNGMQYCYNGDELGMSNKFVIKGKPSLKVDPNYLSMNVEAEEKDPNSP